LVKSSKYYYNLGYIAALRARIEDFQRGEPDAKNAVQLCLKQLFDNHIYVFDVPYLQQILSRCPDEYNDIVTFYKKEKEGGSHQDILRYVLSITKSKSPRFAASYIPVKFYSLDGEKIDPDPSKSRPPRIKNVLAARTMLELVDPRIFEAPENWPSEYGSATHGSQNGTASEYGSQNGTASEYGSATQGSANEGFQNANEGFQNGTEGFQNANEGFQNAQRELERQTELESAERKIERRNKHIKNITTFFGQSAEERDGMEIPVQEPNTQPF